MSDSEVKVEGKLDLGEMVTLEPQNQITTNAEPVSNSTVQDEAKYTNGSGSESSDAELLLANEEEQEIDLRFSQREANERAETSDGSRVAVQQLAKSSLTTRESGTKDVLKAEGAEEFIPCRRTSMLTADADAKTDSELDEVSAETLEANERRKRELIFTTTAVGAVLLLVAGGFAIRRALSR